MLTPSPKMSSVNADTKFDPVVLRHVGILCSHVALNLDRASCRVDRTGELDQYAVARGLDDTAAMLDDLGIEKSFSECLQLRERALFVGAHEPTITGDVRRQHSRQAPFHPPVDRKSPQKR